MNKMKTTEITALTLPAGSPARFYLAGAALVLALLAIPHIGHAQGVVAARRKAHMKATGLPVPSVAPLAERSEPASVAPSVRWTAYSAFPITATIIAAVTTTATVTSAAIDKFVF
jgi:hypothetical protein